MEQFEDKVTPMQLQEELKWAVDTFPALHKYKIEHNTDNLQKLCVQIADFCRAVYASTRNTEERKIYQKMIDKLSKV